MDKEKLSAFAGLMAIEAVRGVTNQIQVDIQVKNKYAEIEEAILEKYFVHPCKTNWMDGLVVKWAKDNKKVLEKLHYANTISYLQDVAKKKIEDSKGLLNVISSIYTKLKSISFYFILVGFLAPHLLSAQSSLFDTANIFSKYTNSKKGVSFFYPKNWKSVNTSTLKVFFQIDLSLQDSVNCKRVDEKETAVSLIYCSLSNLFTDTTELFLTNEMEQLYDLSINKNNSNENFKLIERDFFVNKCGAKYFYIKFYSSIKDTPFVFYEASFIRGESLVKDNYEIEMNCGIEQEQEYDKIFEFICDNFSFIPKQRVKKKGNSIGSNDKTKIKTK